MILVHGIYSGNVLEYFEKIEFLGQIWRGLTVTAAKTNSFDIEIEKNFEDVLFNSKNIDTYL